MSVSAYGIDVASYQFPNGADFNWPVIAQDNISFMFVKLTEVNPDGSHYENPYASEAISGGKSVGIATGGYHFGHTDAAGECAFFLDALRRYGLLTNDSLIPMLDVEVNSTDDAYVSQFITTFFERGGLKLCVYASDSYFQSVLHPDLWHRTGIYYNVANYNGSPGSGLSYLNQYVAFHQHTSQGIVPGTNGPVDKDVIFNGYTLDDMLYTPIKSSAVEVPEMMFLHNLDTNGFGLLFESTDLVDIDPIANIQGVAQTYNVPILNVSGADYTKIQALKSKAETVDETVTTNTVVSGTVNVATPSPTSSPTVTTP